MNSRVRPALFAVTAMRASTLYDTHTRHQRLQRARQRRREHVRALSAGLLVLGGAAVYLDSASAYTPREASGPGAEPQTMEQLLTAVTEDVDAYWTQAFRDAGLPEPKVGYAWIPAGQTATSACGDEQGTVGDDAAAYCPGDDTIYISQKFATDIYDGALDEALPGSSQGYGHTIGDFSVAYLVAHEYGHQVQDELGSSSATASRFRRWRSSCRPTATPGRGPITPTRSIGSRPATWRSARRRPCRRRLRHGQPGPPRDARAARGGLESRLRVRRAVRVQPVPRGGVVRARAARRRARRGCAGRRPRPREGRAC